ncbi:hypothetical protein HK099_004422 [Clydaea vesicula]|uniref:SGTA homodimerisation domain-containing protein n=1 Tax=Clydaea vesicula TaxID=447962 RepID=A0AAD5U9U7_9FUNG|nr:hypothetical protein HK099_004422 [Clydaea vesicula]
MSNNSALETRKKLAYSICDFLNQSIKNNTIEDDHKEGIEVAVQCIAEAFSFDLEKDQGNYSIKPATLLGVFEVFQKTQKNLENSNTNSNQQSAESDLEKKKKSELLKSKGNKKMAEKNYKEAIDFYTQAIEVDNQNAVFYANRAAAHSQNGDHANAVVDSKLAIEVDPDYSKAYSRMGHAQFCMGDYKEAVQSYESGLALDPENQTMKQSLASAKAKLNEKSSTTKGEQKSTNPLEALGLGLPGGAGAGGMPGGMDFASMMSNPALMNMAQQMMSNPNMAGLLNNPAVSSMAQNLMSNPGAL